MVVGARGTATSWDYDEHITVQTEEHPVGTRIPVDEIPAHESGGLRNLVHCLEQGTPLSGPISVETSLAGQRIVEAAATSAAERRTVALDERG